MGIRSGLILAVALLVAGLSRAAVPAGGNIRATDEASSGAPNTITHPFVKKAGLANWLRPWYGQWAYDDIRWDKPSDHEFELKVSDSKAHGTISFAFDANYPLCRGISEFTLFYNIDPNSRLQKQVVGIVLKKILAVIEGSNAANVSKQVSQLFVEMGQTCDSARFSSSLFDYRGTLYCDRNQVEFVILPRLDCR